jgi:hypothetical protein
MDYRSSCHPSYLADQVWDVASKEPRGDCTYRQGPRTLPFARHYCCSPQDRLDGRASGWRAVVRSAPRPTVVYREEEEQIRARYFTESFYSWTCVLSASIVDIQSNTICERLGAEA